MTLFATPSRTPIYVHLIFDTALTLTVCKIHIHGANKYISSIRDISNAGGANSGRLRRRAWPNIHMYAPNSGANSGPSPFSWPAQAQGLAKHTYVCTK